jgi:triphosphatase
LPARHQGSPVLPETVVDAPGALAHIIGHLADVVLANARLAAELDATGFDAVHQMRVAIRRARSALSVFRPAVEPSAFDAINHSLKALGGQLGPSRDWDVFVDETMPSIRQALSGDRRIDRLAAAAARRRREQRSALTTYLAGAEFRRLGIELACFAASGSWRTPPVDPPQPLSAFAAAVLQHRWKKLVSAGKRMAELDISGLHGVRLRAKRARYAAEMFATLYPGKTARRFVNRLDASAGGPGRGWRTARLRRRRCRRFHGGACWEDTPSDHRRVRKIPAPTAILDLTFAVGVWRLGALDRQTASARIKTN